MANPIWNGVISFGLLHVPVQLFPGERSVDLHFRMLDARDRQPIRYERVNSETGKEVPWKDVVKAFEYEKGSYVVVDEETIKSAAPEATETVEIESFVEQDEISPMFYEKPYYLVPGKRAEKAYVLLRETLKKTRRVGIAKVVIRTRQYLAMMMPVDNALVLNLLRFPQEVIDADEYKLPSESAHAYRVTPKEVEMAAQLVDTMTAKWDPEQYKDDFRDKLKKAIEARIEEEGAQKPVKRRAKTPKGAATNVVDFMSLLKKSLETKKSGGGDSEHAAKKPRRAPRRAAAHKTRKRA
jgi:DNA end-binding protein Ku